MEESPLARARVKALHLLASRPRTESQLRDRLVRAGFEPQAGEVIEWLRELRYLDDAAYARDRARSLLAPGRLGPRLAEARLVAAGVAREMAQRAVAEALAGDREPVGAADGASGEARGALAARGSAAEAERCRLLAERRAPRPLAELDDRERARLGRLLLARGFSGPAVSAALGLHVDDDGER